jgi:hypothetical protein
METAYLLDLYDDGKPVFFPNVGNRVGFYELIASKPAVEWKYRELSPAGAGHGMGHGDINGDGRIDLIVPKGWYEQPARRDGEWQFHPEWDLGAASIEILGHDFDGDGDTDIAWGAGHNFGLFWSKQSVDAQGKRVWTQESIDDSFSQVHVLHLTDFDGDGTKEFLTGKRIYAHASEPGATDAPCLHHYRFDRGASKWVKTVIYRGEPAPAAPANPEQRDAMVDFRRGSAGTGLQMVIRDLDQDGDEDIVAPGKSGLYWFENLRLNKAAGGLVIGILIEPVDGPSRLEHGASRLSNGASARGRARSVGDEKIRFGGLAGSGIGRRLGRGAGVGRAVRIGRLATDPRPGARRPGGGGIDRTLGG